MEERLVKQRLLLQQLQGWLLDFDEHRTKFKEVQLESYLPYQSLKKRTTLPQKKENKNNFINDPHQPTWILKECVH